MGGVALLALGIASSVHADRVLHASPRGEFPIEIDGRLNDAAWQRTEQQGNFVERHPVPRARPPVETFVRVLYDAEAIYVGVTCELAPGEAPAARELIRDHWRIFSDDAISLKFDVRHDERNTVGFVTTPAGTQLDYVAIDNGRTFRTEFDAVWEVATHTDAHAWYAEFRIPVTALGFPPAEGPRVIGFNVTRDHNAERATYDWSHIPPEFGAVAASHYGDLVGVQEVGAGRPLSLIPYAAVAWLGDDESRLPRGTPWHLNAGGEARLRLSEDMWTELTVMTDFAEVDLDEAIVNLTRFPLLLPEKRPFFLSGLDVFEFGSPGNAQLFFSRRIGLNEEGQEVPMYAGLKLYGRVGRVGLGLLDVVTGDPTTNWLVSRVRVNAGASSYVGIMSTIRHDEAGRTDYAVGGDFLARVADQRLEFAGSFASSINELAGEPASDETSVGHAADLSLLYRTEEWAPSLTARWISQEYAPAVGFVRRTDAAEARAAVTHIRRFESETWEYVQTIVDATHVRDAELGSDLGFDTGLQLQTSFGNGLILTADLRWIEDVVREDFSLVPDVIIAAGRYRGLLAAFDVAMASTRNPWGHVRYSANQSFYGGIAHVIEAFFSFSIGPHLRFSNGTTTSILDLPGAESFVTSTFGSTLVVAPSTHLTTDFGFQYSNVEEEGVLLSRLRWRYLPGSDLFLVYRFLWRYGQLEPDQARSDHRVTLKVSYRFDTIL